MYKIYQIKWTGETRKQKLYFKFEGEIKLNGNALLLKKGASINTLTYFNSFSLSKWKLYTSINKLAYKMVIRGNANVEIIGLGNDGIKIISSISVSGDYEDFINIECIQESIIGFRIKAESDCNIESLVYYGDFKVYRDLNIGVSICTFRREEYVKRTISKLQKFSLNNKWLNTLVVDNGSTLGTYDSESLKIVYNSNYGGSGGFTRGLIENLEHDLNDYVLLMDDDIDLEISSIERMYSLLCGLKEEYKDSFISGAMLRMNDPCIQHENTAYWGKIRLHSLGQGWDLSQYNTLLKNEEMFEYQNQYGAWWFCCIPLKRVKEIGFPLPVFIKGDDIEYGIRNNKKVIHMNGIGVWHETFEGKQAAWVNYFAYRNFFIINQYAKGCNRWTLCAMTLGRLCFHFIKGHFENTKVLAYALEDAIQGFEGITAVPADEKLKEVRSNKFDKSYLSSFMYVVFKSICCLLKYREINLSYIDFRDNKLKDSEFWKTYLHLK